MEQKVKVEIKNKGAAMVTYNGVTRELNLVYRKGYARRRVYLIDRAAVRTALGYTIEWFLLTVSHSRSKIEELLKLADEVQAMVVTAWEKEYAPEKLEESSGF